MYLLLPTTFLAQLTKGGRMTLRTIPPTYAGCIWCGKSRPIRNRPLGTSWANQILRQDCRSTIDQLVERSVRRRQTEIERATLILCFQSVLRLLQVFNLFSRSAFQKPFHFNKAILQMKKNLKSFSGKVSK